MCGSVRITQNINNLTETTQPSYPQTLFKMAAGCMWYARTNHKAPILQKRLLSNNSGSIHARHAIAVNGTVISTHQHPLAPIRTHWDPAGPSRTHQQQRTCRSHCHDAQCQAAQLGSLNPSRVKPSDLQNLHLSLPRWVYSGNFSLGASSLGIEAVWPRVMWWSTGANGVKGVNVAANRRVVDESTWGEGWKVGLLVIL